MARLAATIASLVAAVAALGSAVNWLSDNLGDLSIAIAGITVAMTIAVAWLIVASETHNRRYEAYFVVTLAVAFLTGVFGDPDLQREIGFLVATAALLPVAVELYLRDRRSRTRCPDCCEEIRADARVCKHCGFRVAPTSPAAPPD